MMTAHGRHRALADRPRPQPRREGFRVSADAVDYLIEARDKGGSIVARDTSLGRGASSSRRCRGVPAGMTDNDH
jgi:hypothetical protein